MRFTESGITRIGKIVSGKVIDLSAVSGVRYSMRNFLIDFDALATDLEAATSPEFAINDVTLNAPIDDPQKFLAIGMNLSGACRRSRGGWHSSPDQSTLLMRRH